MKINNGQKTLWLSRKWSELKCRLHGLANDPLVWLLFGLALIVRLLYWWMISEQSPMETLLSVPPDTRRYIQLARDFCHFTITNESNIYMTGFGYSSFLAVLLLVSGMSFHFALFAQIVLSAVTSVLLYKIGVLLTGKRVVGLIAALIHVFSITALALSASFLSETLFLFLICVVVMVFIRIVRCPGGLDYLALGFLLAFVVFTRSVAQFLPLVFLIIGALIPRSGPGGRKPGALKRIAGGVAISFILIFTWAVRNYVVNDTLMVAGTGPGAAAFYLGVRVAAERSDSLSVIDYRNEFSREIGEWKNTPLTPREANHWYLSKVRELFREDPKSFIKTYLGIVKENILAIDYMTELRMSDYKWRIRRFVQFPNIYHLDIVLPALAALGLLTLLLKRMMLSALLLSSLYFYFAGISGFTYWQGSRILFPGMLSLAVLVGVALYYPLAWSAGRIGPLVWPPLVRRLQPVRTSLVLAIGFPNRLFKLSVADYRRILITTGLALMTILVVAIIVSDSKAPIYRPVEFSSGYHFTDDLTLREMQLEEHNGRTRDIIFYFSLTSRIPDHYKIFFHLYPFPGDGSPMVNRDFEPKTPTSLWPVGQVISERRELDLAPGDYAVLLGFHNANGRLGESISFRISVK